MIHGGFLSSGGLAAWISALTTVVLAIVTWRYVILTKRLVDQNQEIVEDERKRETTRRRRMAVSLRDIAAELRTEFHALRESYPGNIAADRIEAHQKRMSNVLQLAFDVRVGAEAEAVRAHDSYRAWLTEGRQGPNASDAEREQHYAAARDAMKSAHQAMEAVLSRADEFVKSGEVPT